MYNPLNNLWYGADRCRNLHIRLPFTTHLIVHAAKPILKITAVRHRGNHRHTFDLLGMFKFHIDGCPKFLNCDLLPIENNVL